MKPHKPYGVWVVVLIVVIIVGVSMYIGTAINDRTYAVYNKLIEKELPR